MLEVELKSVVDDMSRRRAMVEQAGGVLVFEGRLEDKRYDVASRALTDADHVLRLRVYRDASGARAELDWKGPTRRQDGYKLREELGVELNDPDTLALILSHLGYRVVIAIDREIAQYELDGAMVRFERYPRMDDLVEVEGTPEQIERAIAAVGLPREGFVTDRLSEFALRFSERTGQAAALADIALPSQSSFDEASV